VQAWDGQRQVVWVLSAEVNAVVAKLIGLVEQEIQHSVSMPFVPSRFHLTRLEDFEETCFRRPVKTGEDLHCRVLGSSNPAQTMPTHLGEMVLIVFFRRLAAQLLFDAVLQ